MWQYTRLTLRVFHQAFVVLHHAFVLVDHLLLVLHRLLRNGIPRQRGLVTLQVDRRFFQQCFVARQLAFRLSQRRLVRPRIDIDQRIAFLHRLTFAVMHRR